MRLPRKLYLVCFRRKMRAAISSKLFNGYRFASALIETGPVAHVAPRYVC